MTPWLFALGAFRDQSRGRQAVVERFSPEGRMERIEEAVDFNAANEIVQRWAQERGLAVTDRESCFVTQTQRWWVISVAEMSRASIARVCQECKGSGKYVGLMTIEPCRACQPQNVSG